MRFIIAYVILLTLLTGCTFKQSSETIITDKTGTIPSERMQVTSAFTRKLKNDKFYYAYTSKLRIVEYDKSGKFPKMLSNSDFAFVSIPSSYALAGKTIALDYGDTITKTVIRWSFTSDEQPGAIFIPSDEFSTNEFLKSTKPKL